MLTDSLNSLSDARMLGGIDLLVLPVAAAHVLRGGAHTASNASAILVLGTMGELDIVLCRLLFDLGLVHVHTSEPRGLVLFVRSELIDDLGWLDFGNQHCVSYDSLGQYGRFANQLIEVAHTILYGLRNQAQPMLPSIGLEMFVPRIARWCTGESGLSRYQVQDFRHELALWSMQGPPVDVDFAGYFQSATQMWHGHKGLLQLICSPPDRIAGIVHRMVAKLRESSKVLGIHVRRGDYVDSPSPMFRVVPAGWMRELISSVRREHGDVAVYVATDDPAWVMQKSWERRCPHGVRSRGSGRAGCRSCRFPCFATRGFARVRQQQLFPYGCIAGYPTSGRVSSMLLSRALRTV